MTPVIVLLCASPLQGSPNRALYEPGQSSVHPTPRKKSKAKHSDSDSSADPSRSHEKPPTSEGVKNTGSKKTVKPKPEEPFKGVLLPKDKEEKKVDDKKTEEKKTEDKKTDDKKVEEKKETKKETKKQIDSSDDPLAKLIGGRKKKGDKIDPDRPYYKDDEPEEEEYKKKDSEETPDKKYKKEEKEEKYSKDKSSKYDKNDKYSKEEEEEEEEEEDEGYGQEKILPVNEEDIVELWGRK